MNKEQYYSEQSVDQHYQQMGTTFALQQFTPPVSSSPVQFGPEQEQYYYTQPQHKPSIFQEQQQQPNCEPCQFQQNSYPSTNIIYNNSSAFTQPSSENPHEYLQWLQQTNRNQDGARGAIQRPWWMWCMGWWDILYAIYLAGAVVYKTFVKPVDPDEDSFGVSTYQLFIGFLGVILRLLMGAGLMTGLRSNDDSNTLWYCKMWTACQLLLVIISVIGLLAGALLYATYNPRTRTERPDVFRIFVVLIGRVLSLILVHHYIGKLKNSETKLFGNGMPKTGNAVAYSNLQQGHVDEEEQENKGYPYGSGMYGPTVALIMSV